MTMTATQMIPAVGQDVMVRMESLSVSCKVLDVKCSYGRPRLLIAPLSGGGQQWIETSRITAVVNGSQLGA